MANDGSTVDLLASSSNYVCPIDTGSIAVYNAS